MISTGCLGPTPGPIYPLPLPTITDDQDENYLIEVSSIKKTF